jgi:hypothetical protein
LDALVRKSLLLADRSSGRTRFSMLETIRQFAEEKLGTTGEATEARTAHARYFAQRETDTLALWDGPWQREAYDWFTVELANLRTAFRWAADHEDLDVAAAIATYGGFFGFLVENLEPVAWAESSSSPPAASTTPDSQPCIASHRSATSPDGPMQDCAISTPVLRRSALAVRRCRSDLDCY